MKLVCIAPNGILELWHTRYQSWYVTNHLHKNRLMDRPPKFWGRIVLGKL